MNNRIVNKKSQRLTIICALGQDGLSEDSKP